ncbi:Uncharacterized protein TPAR_08387 [Tolypocladium paradoxum]|uniref:Fe2OG dioxygenase domain-containing protein n=1 Tax=Tolypocladium paradoxum TaxID=94208 RepID=A0A2S4KMJ5_9HYPO|nr:Uncharacterized protein TPAR_08387 [Tolypocladium paradoxum]
MAHSKSAKRKRNAQVNVPKKLTKTTSITPPPDGAPCEPKSLQTVISDEELDVTIETLTTLAQYPSLTKSKACKDLRVAVYDFRQSCTTGVNAAGRWTALRLMAKLKSFAEGANLTARVTAALADEKYLDARILLAEMRLRCEQPKLGALCRWVRDLDVVTQPRGVSLDSPSRSARDGELLGVLDAVLRVSCPIDCNTKPPSSSSSRIALQTTWDLRPPTAPHQVYASVLDRSILSSAPDSLRIVETTPGHLRKPPNHHPAILYASEPNTVRLSSDCPPIEYHNHPNVPNLGLATNVLWPAECKAIIAAGESVGFLPDTPIREGGDTSVLAHNFYWIVDTAFHDTLWSRMSPFVPASVNGRLSRGLNRRFRVYRYVPGAEYRCHIDGAWPPSGIRPDGTYVYDDSPAGKKQSSLFTFLLYLNDEFQGGETTFFMPAPLEGTLNAYPVRPVMGAVAVFPHGEARGALLHEGTSVRKGAKYIIRTDIDMLINGSTAFAMVIEVLFYMGNLEDALTSPTSYPFMEIFLQATYSVSRSATMASIITTLAACATVRHLASTFRVFWSLARDIVTTVISCLLALVNVGSSAVFIDVVSISVSGLYSSYLAAASLLLYRRCTNGFKLPDLPDQTTLPALADTSDAQLVWGP